MIVSIAEEMNPTKRNNMEDTHTVAPNLLPGVDFVGVYDGHGGRDIADFVKTALHENIRQELQATHSSNSQSLPSSDDRKQQAGTPEDTCSTNSNEQNQENVDTSKIETQIEQAFLLTDIQSHMAGLTTSGATAAVILIDRRQQQPKDMDVVDETNEHSTSDSNTMRYTLYGANVGDARVVLKSPKWSAQTIDTRSQE